MRSINPLAPAGKVEIPIADRPWPAGSGIDDFPTPTGVRNSTRRQTFEDSRTNPENGRSWSSLARAFADVLVERERIIEARPEPVWIGKATHFFVMGRRYTESNFIVFAILSDPNIVTTASLTHFTGLLERP